MRSKRRRFLAVSGGIATSLLAGLGLGAAPALAEGWPERPVTVVVPFPPGGGTDTFARPLTAALTQQLGQTFLVENRGGGGGTLGAGTAARAANDGYTFFLGGVHHAIAPGVYPKLAYDLEKDFQPIAVVAVVPQVIVVNPTRVKATTLQELVDFARTNPGALSYGSAGSGTSHHLAGELFKNLAKVDIQHVPYKGAGPALQDLLGGQIDMMFDGSARRPATSSRAASGRWPSRPRPAPDPPRRAHGRRDRLEGYEVTTWYAIWGVAGTPKPIMDRMVTEVGKALDSEQLKTIWHSQGSSPGPLTPDAMASFVSAEIARWGKIAKDGNVKIE
jgi:tripartite-type tricarboxylate transporter receptor subunit TctC